MNGYAFQFSGGKDSLAALYFLRQHWDAMTVYWCNTGDPVPETVELVERVKREVPHFVEVAGNRAKVRELLGDPFELVPAQQSFVGQLGGKENLLITDSYTCCFKSLMEPLHEKMRADGVTHIIRGQRNDEQVKSPVQDGETVDGFTIHYPIVDWTEQQVFDYLKQNDLPVPSYYKWMKSSPECLHCTGWTAHNQLAYLDAVHPEVATEVRTRVNTMINKVIPILTEAQAYARTEK